MFTYLFHEYFRADEAWKAWGNEQIDAYTFQHTPRDGRLYTIHGNQPAIFFIPSSRYYSNDLSNFLQELEAGSTATYAINSRGERERGLVNLHGLSPSALPRYRDRDHSLSLSLRSL